MEVKKIKKPLRGKKRLQFISLLVSTRMQTFIVGILPGQDTLFFPERLTGTGRIVDPEL